MTQEPQISESTRRLLFELYSPIGQRRISEAMRPFVRIASSAAEATRALESLSEREPQ